MSHRRAVVVGVADYAKAGIPNLRYSSNDASHFARLLVENAGFSQEDVALFDDRPLDVAGPVARSPHRSDILSQLQRFAEASDTSDMLVFFFAGHGGEIGNKSYLLTNDTRLNVIDTTSLKVQEINEVMEEAKASCKLRFFDACRAPFEGTRGTLPGPMSKGFESALSAGAGASVTFTACSPGEFAYEHPDLKHGLFSHFVCLGMSGIAATNGGPITIEGLVNYVKLSVRSECARRQYTQTPQLFGIVTGSPILVAEQVVVPVAPVAERTSGPLEDLTAFLWGLRSDPDEAVRAARATHTDELEILHAQLFVRLERELNKLKGEFFEIAASGLRHVSETDMFFWQQIRQTLRADKLFGQVDKKTVPSRNYELSSRSAIVPGAKFTVAILRLPYFYRVCFRIVPVLPDPALAANTGLSDLSDYVTVLPSAASDDAKLDEVAGNLLVRMSGTLQGWTDQCSKVVRTMIDRERSHGEVVH